MSENKTVRNFYSHVYGITYSKPIFMIWLEFGLGGFAQSFFLSLEREIFVSFMKDKNVDKFHFAVYILIFDPSQEPSLVL